MIAYVKHQGSKIVRKSHTLQVKKGDDVLQTLFVHRLNQLVLFGHVELTSNALNMLCWENIDTIFMTINGRFKGRLLFDPAKNVILRKKQFDSLNQPEFCLKIVRSVVAGKLANMATLLGRIKRRNKHLDNTEFEKQVNQIRELLKKLPDANNIDSLRGYEGKGTAVFFPGIWKRV